jgi:hypothetical protein
VLAAIVGAGDGVGEAVGVGGRVAAGADVSGTGEAETGAGGVTELVGDAPAGPLHALMTATAHAAASLTASTGLLRQPVRVLARGRRVGEILVVVASDLLVELGPPELLHLRPGLCIQLLVDARRTRAVRVQRGAVLIFWLSVIGHAASHAGPVPERLCAQAG